MQLVRGGGPVGMYLDLGSTCVAKGGRIGGAKRRQDQRIVECGPVMKIALC